MEFPAKFFPYPMEFPTFYSLPYQISSLTFSLSYGNSAVFWLDNPYGTSILISSTPYGNSTIYCLVPLWKFHLPYGISILVIPKPCGNSAAFGLDTFMLWNFHLRFFPLFFGMVYFSNFILFGQKSYLTLSDSHGFFYCLNSLYCDSVN